MLASPFFSVLLCHLIPITDNKKKRLCIYTLWYSIPSVKPFFLFVRQSFPSLLDLLIWSCDKMMSLLIVAVIWFFSPFPNSQFYRKRRYIFRPLYFLFLAEVPFFSDLKQNRLCYFIRTFSATANRIFAFSFKLFCDADCEIPRKGKCSFLQVDCLKCNESNRMWVLFFSFWRHMCKTWNIMKFEWQNGSQNV